MFAAAVAILALVLALLALAWRPGRRVPMRAGRERIWIGGLGLAFPVAGLLLLLGYGLAVGERLIPRDAPDIVRVQAEARRWAWTFTYDSAPGRTTTDVLHIPAQRPVHVSITSSDVIHSFWVPRLAGKLDAIPGHVNVLRIEADEAGVFAGQSSEFSGRGYDSHAFTVVAHPPDTWQAFIEGGE